MSKFRAASVFSNHMVLQRHKNINVFGEGENGDLVTLSFNGQTYSETVKDNRWNILIPPMEAGDGYEMVIISGENKIHFTDISIGEVWLAGGQSNMEFELQNCTEGPEAMRNDVNPRVRFYYTQKNSYMDEKFYEMENASSWEVFGAEGTKSWSAAGYFFARRIAKELGVTVGVIGCNWGGTSASAWVSREALEEDAGLRSYVDEYDSKNEGKSVDLQRKEYDEYVAYQEDWDKRAARFTKENPKLTWHKLLELAGPNLYPGPVNIFSPFRPAGLYQCMLQRVMPYTLRGFIYYQGESDDHKPNMYQKLLTRLIRQWREDWQDDELPFLFVQLTMHRNEADPDYKHWCLVREAQMRTFKTVKNTGMAVITDCGEFNDIHPKRKEPVGERLALQALSEVYSKIDKSQAFGPMYRSFELSGNKIILSFDYADQGFKVSEEITGFEIAGEDKEFYPAQAAIEENKISLSCENVSKPMYARYCWTNYGPVTVFGVNGLPMAPFRTSYDI